MPSKPATAEIYTISRYFFIVLYIYIYIYNYIYIYLFIFNCFPFYFCVAIYCLVIFINTIYHCGWCCLFQFQTNFYVIIMSNFHRAS